MASYKAVVPACSPHGEALALQSVRTQTRKQAAARRQTTTPGSRSRNARSCPAPLSSALC
ncbi:rCG50236 [Rattus norvegicus]|uniref:RCG50236 n=1 Tax=Rattus norvegicus TaxID=10116 RepID=A6JZ79_RAT|nr:rCG50236 [Rattus norvegicus]